MRIIAIANHKGGCGKTTTSINFAASLAKLDKKVLIVDLDPQGHSTCGLGVKAENQSFTLYDLLHFPIDRTPKAEDLICSVTENLDLIPTYGILAAIEEELIGLEGREERLSLRLFHLLNDGTSYDYVILDCPPNLGLITYNALRTCDEIIIPIEPSFFSLHGLGKMMETLEVIEEKAKNPIQVHALLTIYNASLSFAQEVYDDVKEHFQERMFKTVIHEDVSFKEAAAAGQSIADYAEESKAYQDYYNLSIEFLEREWSRKVPGNDFGWDKVHFHRFGPKRVSGGILFQLQSLKASWVEVAGDFNNWVPEPLVKREANLWQKVIPVHQGKYRYKFIVDGEWQVDPYQQELINEYGTKDSLIEVS